jgi:hypothetical protein
MNPIKGIDKVWNEDSCSVQVEGEERYWVHDDGDEALRGSIAETCWNGIVEFLKVGWVEGGAGLGLTKDSTENTEGFWFSFVASINFIIRFIFKKTGYSG